MGSVFRVHDAELDEEIALKLLHLDPSESEARVRRFRQEVKLARRVTHPNVARTFDIGEHRGFRFLTMELVTGQTLADLLEARGALPIRRALEIARMMCAGLAAAHRAGVVHRDLKPENVCIDEKGRVVLMDFGSARAPTLDDGHTPTGMLGTPAYMAPEQVQGSLTIDARADIYSFGAVLYEMLTGAVAWQGGSAYLVATARLTSPPPDPRASRAEISREVAELVKRCMATEPRDRFPDTAVLLAALDALPAVNDTGPPPSGRARERAPSADSGDVRGQATPARPVSTDKIVRTSGVEGFTDDLVNHRALMADRAPVYTRVLELLEELLRKPEGARVRDALERAWQKRTFEGPFERPLLILAALRFDALVEGASHPLHRVLAQSAASPVSVTGEALKAALAPERLGFWITLRSRRVQTNEVSRAIAWLWPATLAASADVRRPIALVDVGTSAGLNLVADRLALSWRRRDGAEVFSPKSLEVRARVGFDARPLDVRRKEDCMWLEACVWPNQTKRLERLKRAMATFQTTSPPPEVQLMRASSVVGQLDRIGKQAGERGLTLVFHTLIRNYVPSDEWRAFDEGISSWLQAGARGSRALASLEFEDAQDADFGCVLEVRASTGGGVARHRLGKTSYHPDVVEVDAAAEREIVSLLR